MLRRLLLVAFLAFPPVAAGAQDLAPYEREAEAVLQRLRSAMMAEMQRAMSEGPAAAIAVCRHLAPQISAAIEADTGWAIRRPSLRVRNPEMRPTAAERGILLGFEARHAAGQPVQMLHALRTSESGGRMEIHFMQAIPMMDGCLACHGPALDPETAAAIRELYPQDEAIGYAVGDLRGAFSLTKTVAVAEQRTARPTAAPRSRLEALGYVPTERPGARGNAARGAEIFGRQCQSCHAPDQLATHSFGDGDPAAGEAVCRKLETHGYTSRGEDCDVVAFLNDLALFLAARK